ncbi:MAG: CCA tRNA nucleotidyltransferase [PVC group bacterium]
MMDESIDLNPIISERLSPRLIKILRMIGRFADARGWNVFCVGGSVRDLLEGGRDNFDLDILVEAHGLQFAREFARSVGGCYKLYRRFATALVIMPGGIKIDVTTTREEYYPEPGALPRILPGSLKEDLLRRDFTINAMAFSLNEGRFGRLIDLCGGLADLRARVIRVLHERSFRDDPTRIFRAVRFQQRLGFMIEPRTEELMRTAVDLRLFEKVSPERLRHELELIFREPDPPSAVAAMARYDELRFIHPRLAYSRELAALLDRVNRNHDWFRRAFPAEDVSRFRLYFGALLVPLSAADTARTGEKFNLSRQYLDQLLAGKKDAREIARVLSSPDDVPPSRIFFLLQGRSPEIVLIIMSRIGSDESDRRIRTYLSGYRSAAGEVGGEDLKELGLPPGPAYKRILHELLAARLDGMVRSREEELRLAHQLVDKLKKH